MRKFLRLFKQAVELAHEEHEFELHFYPDDSSSLLSCYPWAFKEVFGQWWSMHRCKALGHDWRKVFVDPESGATEMHCNRCHHERSVFF